MTTTIIVRSNGYDFITPSGDKGFIFTETTVEEEVARLVRFGWCVVVNGNVITAVK